MAKTLSNIGISESYTVEAAHVSQSVDAFTGIDAYDISLSGSFNLTGSLTVDGLSTTTQTDVLTFNNTSNQVFYTSSAGFLGPLSSSLVTTINDVSSSFETTIDNVSSSIITTINDVSASLSASIGNSDTNTNIANTNLTSDANRTLNLDGNDLFISVDGNFTSTTATDAFLDIQAAELTLGFSQSAQTQYVSSGITHTGNTSIVGTLDVNGNTTVTGSLTASGSSHTVEGDTTIDGNTTISGSSIITGSLEIIGSNTRAFVVQTPASGENAAIISGSSLLVGPAENSSCEVGVFAKDTGLPGSSKIAYFSRVGVGTGQEGIGRMIIKNTASAKLAGITAEINGGGIYDSFLGDSSLGIGSSYEYQFTSSYLLELDADSAGKPTSNTWTITSDERLKENIITASLDTCYNGIKNIPLKRFGYIEGFTKEPLYDQHKIGWIAQDVEAVFPKAVTTSSFTTWVTYTGSNPITGSGIGPDGEPKILYPGERYQDVLAGSTVINDRKSLDSDQLMKMMYGAIQKLQLKVEALEAQISGSA